jgi:tetratricopeptide (TPR) repeat protein
MNNHRFITAFLCLLLGATSLSPETAGADEPRRDTAPRGASLIELENFTMLTVPGTAGDIEITHFPTKALIEIRFSKPVPLKLRRKLERKIRIGRNPIEAQWRSRKFFRIRLRSMASAVKIIPQSVEDGKLVFIGKKHAITAPARHIFKEECPKLFTIFRASKDDDIFDAYCDGVRLSAYKSKSEQSKAESEIDNPSRHNVLRLLEFMELTGSMTISPVAISRRVSEMTMSPSVIEFSMFTVAMIHALHDDYVKTLESLNQLLAYHEENKGRKDLKVFKEPQLQLVRRLGEGTFERYLEYIFKQGEDQWAKAIATYERFSKWEGPNFDFALKWRIADLYRQMLMPERAITQYLEMLERDTGSQPIKLEKLIASYVEANQPYRAYATFRYLRERYPDHRMDPDLVDRVKKRSTVMP